MTKAEVTELFAALMIAYPDAKLFRGLDGADLGAKLAPTIAFWTACLRDTDPWAARQAVLRVCQTSRFPPSVAELREAAETVQRETDAEIRGAYLAARSEVELALATGGTERDALGHMSQRARRTIEAMGGIDVFAGGDGGCYAMRRFQETYEALLRRNPVGLPGAATGHGLSEGRH